MQAIVPPPTQIVPAASVEMWTRPERPRAVPCRATYGARARPLAHQPLCQRGVEAPGHRVLDERAVLREERAHLERLVRAVGARADDADVEVDEAGLQGQHGVGVGEQERDPGRAVVGPLRVQDLGPVDAEGSGDAAEQFLLNRSRNAAAVAPRTRSRARAGAPRSAPRRTPARPRRAAWACRRRR